MMMRPTLSLSPIQDLKRIENHLLSQVSTMENQKTTTVMMMTVTMGQEEPLVELKNLEKGPDHSLL